MSINEFKNDKLIKKQVKDIRKMISAKGYDSLVTSVLELREENRAEWQVRIDYDPANNDYPVYSLQDRATSPTYILHYRSFEEAKVSFMRLMDEFVAINRRSVAKNEEPLYHSPLWCH